MRVPFLDLAAAHAELRDGLDAAWDRVCTRSHFIAGPELEVFEQGLAAFCGTRYAVGVGNGLDALVLLLRAAGIGPGDEVLVPSHTFVATWFAVSIVGAIPVPVEVDRRTFNMDPGLIEQAITGRTRAIIPVHLYGQLAEMERIAAVADTHGLLVFEDAAQAIGAQAHQRRAAYHGHAAAISFYPGKNLGALGDGGAIVTNDSALSEQVRMLRNYGSREKYHHCVVGVNSRLDELQAAFLACKLTRLEEWNLRRRTAAQRYIDGLRGLPLALPEAPNGHDPVWHLFVVRHSRRDWLQVKLAGAGVETIIHYPVEPARQAAYGGQVRSPTPIAREMADSVLSLPIGPHLSTSQQDHVIEALHSILR